MAKFTKAELKKEYQRAKSKGWLDTFISAGKTNHFTTEHLLALGSRETNLTNELGDGGHGHGILQVDDRSFPAWCKSGAWKDAHASIEKGVEVLFSKRHEVANLAQADDVKLSDAELLFITTAAYNCGSVKAFRNFVNHADADRGTTGGDYATDVFTRAEVFKSFLDAEKPEELAESPDPPATPQPNGGAELEAGPAPSQPTQADVTVEATTVAKSGSKKSIIATIGAGVTALGVSFADMASQAYGAVKSNPLIAIGLLSILGAIVAIYWKFMERQERLDALREQNAHEVNLAKLKYAADPNSNTVDIAPSKEPVESGGASK